LKKEEARSTMRKSLSASSAFQPRSFVDFRLNDTTYQIDPLRRKVYRRFVEVETSRASQIMASFADVPGKKG